MKWDFSAEKPLEKCVTDITEIPARNGIQSMNRDGGRCHDNARCKAMWARMKEELLYGRYDTKQMTMEELNPLIWRYIKPRQQANCASTSRSPMISSIQPAKRKGLRFV